VVPLGSAALLLAAGLGSGLLYYRSLRSSRTVPGISVGRVRLESLDGAQLQGIILQEAEKFLDGPTTLRIGSQTVQATRREIGAKVNVEETKTRLLATGKTGDFLRDLVDRVQARRGRLRVPLATALDRDLALGFFTRLKEEVDRPAVSPRLDLDRATVVPGADGYVLRVYDCMAATELSLGRNEDLVSLAVTLQRPRGNGERLQDLDISHVLGTFTTVYSLADKDADRAHNLKVAASKLDGTVMEPGAQLSFNETVGPRTEAEGYRTAPVITEGELVDGMAGGACQLSSTLFAAAFFAGLELESSRPHTRPSSYIKMGLDAAVAYPGTDLVLKNPYPFPVVVHYRVSQGKVQVRILGKERPWRKIVFEREVKEAIPFKTEVRQASHIPRGNTVVSQAGVPGFRLERRRLFFRKGTQAEAVEKREVRYPATTQYILEGTGPKDASWMPPKQPAPFGDAPPLFTMAQ
jgi:vancomycin resistance protein YoaR